MTADPTERAREEMQARWISEGAASLPDGWVVNVLGGPDGSYEISVLRNERTYAKHSYGWEGPDKIIVSGSGGPCQYKVPPSLFTKLVAVAEDFACELNETERVK